MNFATTLWMLLFVWMVDAAKFGNEEIKRITTSRTSGNVTIEAHHHRNAYWNMDKVDIRNLVKRDCGHKPKISKVKDAIRKFGPDAVFTAKTRSGGDTCLHYAASYGNDHIIEYLAARGCKKFDPKDNERETPLRTAIRKRKYSTITTLIKLGADLEKAKESNYENYSFEKSLEDEETVDAIKKGRSYLKKPRLTAKPPSTIEAEKDSTVDIDCRATGQPSPVIKWFYNGVAISADASHSITGNGLKILNVQVYNIGRYECKAQNIAGSASAHTTLYVQGMEYHTNSRWSNRYDAEKAMKGADQPNYWCSARNGDLPIFWKISFGEVLVQIVKVEFEEKYPGAEFQFFASNDALNCSAEKVLIRGKKENINGIKFENDQSYSCYGLEITQLVNTNDYGPLASVKNFKFFMTECDGNWVSGRNTNGCEEYGDKKYCKKGGDHYGENWNLKKWGKFEDWADDHGRTALVCPQCGCWEYYSRLRSSV